MADQEYTHAALAVIQCGGCTNLAAGDQVDILLRVDLFPTLPVSIRGIVVSVDDLNYTIQYDTDDLGGVPALSPEIVSDVLCVMCLVLANEYTDDQVKPLEEALVALGAVPSDSSNYLILVHPDSEAGVSSEIVKHDKVDVAQSGSASIVLEPLDLVSPMAILDLTGLSYRIEIEVSAISEKSIHDRDSQSTFSLVGQFDKGSTITKVFSYERDGVTITAVLVGNNIHVSTVNPSSGDIVMFVTSKFRILS
tara:strand:- start:589 stop:1341 length:753 start_codon:yes stop_codon:yes gene_type:complete